MTGQRDQLFTNPARQLVDFAFDDAVVAVFPDMIRRSVPGYETVVPLTGLLTARHIRATGGSNLIYDLGCSLGATTLAILGQLGDQDARIVAVDEHKSQ